MGQKFRFAFFDCLLCEVAGVTPYEMHTNVSAMIKVADAAVPLAKHLGVEPPRPHLYGMSYCHVSALGCPVVNEPDSPEPWAGPCISRPEDIDNLREPDDYLAAGIIPERMELARQLKARRGDASTHIGHDFEGPATTAALLMGGEAFFTLPFDDPERSRRLLEFCVRSSLNCARTIRRAQGRAIEGQTLNIPDDFAGIFPPKAFEEFIIPCWEGLYRGMRASQRHLHCELLREAHLPMLAGVRIDEYDPSVDPYLPPETLKRSCPVPYGLRIWPSQVQSMSAEELVAKYRHLASFESEWIMFHLERMADLPKIEALLKTARELE